MADLLGAAAGTITIFPSAVAAAAGAVRGIGVSVRAAVSNLPSGAGVEVIGEQSCAAAMLSTCRLIASAVTTSATGVDDLARSLADAATIYRFADTDAVYGVTG